MEDEEARAVEGDHRPSHSAAAAAPRVSSAGSSDDEGDFFDTQPRGRDVDQDDDYGAASNMDGEGFYMASDIAGRFVQVIGDGKVQYVDTAAPIDSVKGAVSKFGGILDRRERRQQVEDEIDMVKGEAIEYQTRSREAESRKAQALRELSGVTGDIDDLWLTVKRAQIAEAQARKDSELAKRRLRKTEKGARERAAVRTELDAVKDRRAAALADLRSVRAEMDALHKERAAAADEADAVAVRARDAAASSREAGEAVEKVTAELRALREEIDSSRAAHDAAEEKRMRTALALQQDKVKWQAELEQAEQEARKLRDELVVSSDLESKVAAASELLMSLRAELFARGVEGASEEETAGEKPAVSTRSTLGKTRKELEEVNANVEKTKDEAKILQVAAASLRADLEKEKAELAALQRKEVTTSASIPPLVEELSRVTTDLAEAEAREHERRGEGSNTPPPEQLTEARREAERAKASAISAREDVARAREEASVAKATVQATEARLEAVMREILATNASEEMATASADALLQQESTNAQNQTIVAAAEDSVALTAEEYEGLSRRARETEEAAGRRVVEAVKLITEAKDAEVRSLEKLAHLAKQTEQRRQALMAATEEAEEMEVSKAAAERELRQWQQWESSSSTTTVSSPRTGLAEISAVLDDGRGNPHILSPRGGYMPRTADMHMMAAAAGSEEAKQQQQRKTTFFPRMVTYLARKRAQTWSGK